MGEETVRGGASFNSIADEPKIAVKKDNNIISVC
jgi:hypothetical protein